MGEDRRTAQLLKIFGLALRLNLQNAGPLAYLSCFPGHSAGPAAVLMRIRGWGAHRVGLFMNDRGVGICRQASLILGLQGAGEMILPYGSPLPASTASIWRVSEAPTESVRWAWKMLGR